MRRILARVAMPFSIPLLVNSAWASFFSVEAVFSYVAAAFFLNLLAHWPPTCPSKWSCLLNSPSYVCCEILNASLAAAATRPL